MKIQCPNCSGSIDGSNVESAYHAGHESHQPVWIIGDAVTCNHCEIGLGRTRSNDPDRERDWDFHRASDLEIVRDLNESDVDAAKSKLSRYPSMARELDALLARRTESDRTVRYKAAGKTGLAVIRRDAVLGVFQALADF